jgi:hypothetical protein
VLDSNNPTAGPSSSMSAVAGPAAVSTGGMINPLITHSDSNSAEDYPQTGIIKFEDDDHLEDEEDYGNDLSEEGDNSMSVQDMANMEQGAMGELITFVKKYI